MSGEVAGRILHCEVPVRVKSRRFGWDGPIEAERVEMVCAACEAELTLFIRTNVGLPVGVES